MSTEKTKEKSKSPKATSETSATVPTPRSASTRRWEPRAWLRSATYRPMEPRRIGVSTYRYESSARPTVTVTRINIHHRLLG